MKKISFQNKNNLIVKHKNGEYFSKDLELFKKHCPGHILNNELAKANKFSYARLDGLMLSYLLDVVSIEDILENRTQEKQPEPEPRTENEIKTLLIEQCGLDEVDLDALSEIISLWLDKSDEEIISAVKKLLGEKTIQAQGAGDDDPSREIEDDHQRDSSGDSDQGGQTGDITSESQDFGEGSKSQHFERDNVTKFTKRIMEAQTITEVESILKEDKEGGERITVQNAGLNILGAVILTSVGKGESVMERGFGSHNWVRMYLVPLF